MIVQNYYRKADRVQAVQLTADTQTFLASFNGDRTAFPQAVTNGRGTFVITGAGTPIDVPVGSWAALNQNGGVDVYDDATFNNRFVEVS